MQQTILNSALRFDLADERRRIIDHPSTWRTCASVTESDPIDNHPRNDLTDR